MIIQTCPNCNAATVRLEGGPTTCHNGRFEWEMPDPRPEWPKECQDSWASSSRRWADANEDYTMSPQLLAAVAHTLEVNLEYINQLERHIAENE